MWAGYHCGGGKLCAAAAALLVLPLLLLLLVLMCNSVSLIATLPCAVMQRNWQLEDGAQALLQRSALQIHAQCYHETVQLRQFAALYTELLTPWLRMPSRHTG